MGVRKQLNTDILQCIAANKFQNTKFNPMSYKI